MENELHKIFKQKRTEIGLSQKQVADLISIERNAYNAIENGKRKNITVNTLFKIANALNIKIQLQ